LLLYVLLWLHPTYFLHQLVKIKYLFYILCIDWFHMMSSLYWLNISTNCNVVLINLTRGFFNWKHYDAKKIGIPQKNIFDDDMFANKKLGFSLQKLFNTSLNSWWEKCMGENHIQNEKDLAINEIFFFPIFWSPSILMDQKVSNILQSNILNQHNFKFHQYHPLFVPSTINYDWVKEYRKGWCCDWILVHLKKFGPTFNVVLLVLVLTYHNKCLIASCSIISKVTSLVGATILAPQEININLLVWCHYKCCQNFQKTLWSFHINMFEYL
jgi:hypothetical protein